MTCSLKVTDGLSVVLWEPIVVLTDCIVDGMEWNWDHLRDICICIYFISFVLQNEERIVLKKLPLLSTSCFAASILAPP
jgi:hypothetical protein